MISSKIREWATQDGCIGLKNAPSLSLSPIEEDCHGRGHGGTNDMIYDITDDDSGSDLYESSVSSTGKPTSKSLSTTYFALKGRF